MTEHKSHWFTSQIVLSSLIVVLSLFTANISYERSLASSAQLRKNTAGLRELMLGTSAETMANATFQSDLSNYSDAEFATDEDQIQKYELRYSEELSNDIAANPDDPFSDAYSRISLVRPTNITTKPRRSSSPPMATRSAGMRCNKSSSSQPWGWALWHGRRSSKTNGT